MFHEQSISTIPNQYEIRTCILHQYRQILTCNFDYSTYILLAKIDHKFLFLFLIISIMAGKVEPINEQEVAAKYGSIRTEMNQIYSKITELEMEVSEHSLVINAIQPLDPTRRCYRMIGGVLVERTIKEVLPAVQQNKEGIEVVIARLNEALERKKKELTDFETKYKIRIRKNDGDSMDDNSKKEGSAQGVLVGPANA